ncbi:MAG: CBS domain-containing protein [Solirubrobacterales bacterium]
MKLVGETMTDDCQCIGEHASVREAAQRLAELPAGAMPICGDDERLKGMVTDRDIAVKVVAQGKDPDATEVAELAQGTPIWVEADADIDQAVALMEAHKVRRLPVIEDRRLVGIISQADIARQAPAAETADLLASISAAPANN